MSPVCVRSGANVSIPPPDPQLKSQRSPSKNSRLIDLFGITNMPGEDDDSRHKREQAELKAKRKVRCHAASTSTRVSSHTGHCCFILFPRLAKYLNLVWKRREKERSIVRKFFVNKGTQREVLAVANEAARASVPAKMLAAAAAPFRNYSPNERKAFKLRLPFAMRPRDLRLDRVSWGIRWMQPCWMRVFGTNQ